MNLFKKFNLKGLFIVALLISIPIGMLAYTLFPAPPNPDSLPIGYVAQDEVTNFNLKGAGGFTVDPITKVVTYIPGDETLFRVEFDRELWSGNLHAYPLDSLGNIYPTERWGAATTLTAQVATVAGVNGWDKARYIATLNNVSSGATQTASPFRNPISVISGITINTSTSTTYTSSNVIDYLRGDSSKDDSHGGMMRTRASPLGDIIHSRPLFVDDSTNPTVFVGANDGMLHAFNSDTGAERWAYIPSMLLSKINTLAYNPIDPTNTYVHDYFVDGQINTGTILKSGSPIRELIGGLGAGGKGLFALDISDLSNPTAESQVASKILWEITPTGVRQNGSIYTPTSNYSHLGYTFGTPLVVKINKTVGVNPTSTDAIIVGNGYDDTAAGNAHLYVIDAATGSLIKDFTTPVYSGGSGSNGIFNPKAIDINGDGVIDYVYGADLNGSLWKFDLSAGTSSWSNPTAPIFDNGLSQPVTSSLGIASHPSGGYMITFGTGSALHGKYGTYTAGAWTTPGTLELDTANPSTYWVYGIWDNGTGSTVTPSSLQLQTLTPRTYTDSLGSTTRVRRSTAVTPNWSTQSGWKVALPSGERILGEGSFIENGRFYFNSYNPTVAPSAVSGTTTNIYGENWLMELNYLTGGSSASPFLDLDNNQLLNNNDRIVYTSSDTLPSGFKIGDPITSPNEDGIPVGKFISIGVQSQPILVQLATLNTTLLNQNPDVIFPTQSTITRGVAGGHFDIDRIVPTTDCSNLANGAVASNASGSFQFNFGNRSTSSIAISGITINIGGEIVLNANNINQSMTRAALATYVETHYSSGTYNIVASNSSISISAKNSGSAYNVPVTITITPSSSTGFTAPGYTPANTSLSGGVDGTTNLTASSSTTCQINIGGTYHVHEYDKKYDKTGINVLNSSVPALNLSAVITNTTTQFKVLMMNQYLNPAVQFNINYADYKPSYNPSTLDGYIYARDYQTSNISSNTLSSLPTYTMSTIGSLVMNYPVDAFSIKDWWQGSTPDYRAGGMATVPGCVVYGYVNDITSPQATASINSDMYNPVIPPTPNSAGTPSNASGASSNNGSGNGTLGTTTGARHNGAMILQIIKANTPDSALELNVAGQPQYGWRLKSSYYYSNVIVEYAMYWHHPRDVCYGDTQSSWTLGKWNSNITSGSGWTKDAPPDSSTLTSKVIVTPNATDPKLGALGQNTSGITTIDPAVISGSTSTVVIHYSDLTTTTVATTHNTDGTTTIVTTQKDSKGVVIGSPTKQTIADASGSVKTGGDERGLVSKTGRIAWHELLRP